MFFPKELYFIRVQMTFAIMKNSMPDPHVFDSYGSSRQMVGIQATLSFLIIVL